MTYPSHHQELDNQFSVTKALNQCLNPNIGYTMPQAAAMSQAAMSQAAMPPLTRRNITKTQIPEYEQAEAAQSNINLSLNQILGLPYHIVMPQTEINQSISINNLPSLNDLALRTGINHSLNAGMGTIIASPRPTVTAPSPVPLTTPQLILPISSLCSANYTKDHVQLPIPIIDREYIDQINNQQKHTMHTKPQGQHSYITSYPSATVNESYVPNHNNFCYGKILSLY